MSEDRSQIADRRSQIVSLIVAMSRNGVIGRDGDLPWHLPDDMKWFKATTQGHAVIMGRGNWEAMQGRPLPGRRNIVITRQADYEAQGADVVATLDEALALVAGDDEPFIIGGGQVYRLALDAGVVDRMYLTLIDAEVAGDTTFPAYDASAWRQASRTDHPADENHAHAFTIFTLERV